MNGDGKIRKVLTAMLGLTILLWAEAGLGLVTGDRVMACHIMRVHSSAGMMAASGDADREAQDSTAMPCCPQDSEQAPAIAASHPPCCSVSNGTERPMMFLVGSERTTSHPSNTAAAATGSSVPQPAKYFADLWNAGAPRFIRPVLELKTDLRI